MVLALLLLLPACDEVPQRAPAKPRFEAWADAGHREQVATYRAHLERQGLADIVPMEALLRTSRRWRICLHDEFATPPPALQPDIEARLRVVARLRDAGLIDPALARSGWHVQAGAIRA